MKKIILFTLCLCVYLITFTTANAQNTQDITNTGIDFLTNPPIEETVYTAGSGTVTYTPANTSGEPATITLENASIYGATEDVKYWSNNYKKSAILAQGDVNVVIKGYNEIILTKEDSSGLFFYDSNVTIKGGGTLMIDNTGEGESLNPVGMPIQIIGDNDRFYEDVSGNLLIESGNIDIKTVSGRAVNCLEVHHNFTMTGGSLTTDGGSTSIRCVKGEINISDSTVKCVNAINRGIRNSDGNIIISGNSKIDIQSDSDSFFGIDISNDSTDGLIINNGASLNILNGGIGIYIENGGAVNLQNAYLNINVNDIGIYTDGYLQVKGGSLKIAADGTYGKRSFTTGIYCASGLLNACEVDIAVSNMSDSIKQITAAIYSETKFNVNNSAKVTLKSQSANSNELNYGFYSDADDIHVNGGTVIIQGSGAAISFAPDLSNYQLSNISCASDFDGNSIEEYNPENVDSYKYIVIEPLVFSVTYENGNAVIISEKDVENITVVFAAYDENKNLIDCDTVTTALNTGKNNIKSISFNPEDNNVKIMLWNNLINMKPIPTL